LPQGINGDGDRNATQRPYPEHPFVTTSRKRLVAALAFVLPVAALVATPAMAAKHHKAKTHHVHKVAAHKAHKAKKSTAAS
jgi:hypothetical protein